MTTASSSRPSLQFGCVSLGHRVASTAACALALAVSAFATDQFVALNSFAPNPITRLRATSDRWVDTGFNPVSFAPSGLTYDGAHLYWYADVSNLSMLRRLDPLTGQVASVGISGSLGSGLPTLENHPQTGVLYALAQDTLFTIDKNTASKTVVASLLGAPPGTVRSFAIDSSGRAIAMSQDSQLFQLDLATGVLSPLGALGLPNSQFFDLAFDSQDRLWALRNFNSLYSIDVASVSATLESTANVVCASSLAVLPGGLIADWSPYCPATPVSQACLLLPHATNAPASVSAISGFYLSLSTPRAGSPAVLMYGLSGRALMPFHGGTMCVAAPRERAPTQQSGAMSATNCNGFVSLDFAAYAAGGLGGSPNPALQVAGTVVNAQWFVRDSSLGAGTSVLTSAGIEFTLNP